MACSLYRNAALPLRTVRTASCIYLWFYSESGYVEKAQNSMDWDKTLCHVSLSDVTIEHSAEVIFSNG